MRSGTAFGVFAGLALLSQAAMAASAMPRYDVERYCNRMASMTGSHSDITYGACMDQEQESYDAVKVSWASLPAARRQYCNRLATITGTGSYIMLKACVDQESSAARSNSSRSFRY